MWHGVRPGGPRSGGDDRLWTRYEPGRLAIRAQTNARDDRLVLRQARRALKTGGALVVTVPAHPRLWTALDEASGHKRRYTRRSLVEAMREAGFLVCLSRHFNTLLYPVQSLQRHILDGQPIATSAERLALVRRALRVPPGPLNALMRLAMAADLVLSRLPGSLGTS